MLARVNKSWWLALALIALMSVPALAQQDANSGVVCDPNLEPAPQPERVQSDATCPPAGDQDLRADRNGEVDEDDWFDVLADLPMWHNGVMPKRKAPPVEKTTPNKPLPMTFMVDYTLATDVVWRGMNLSEYPGEGREDLSHQLALAGEYDTGFGAVGVVVWFDWWAGLDEAIGGDGHLTEIDYTAYYRLAVPEIAAVAEVGWSALDFTDSLGFCTQEIYGKLTFDDSFIWRRWGRQSALLRPYVFYAVDYRRADWGSWLEVGVQPVFVLDDVTYLKDVPVVRDLTISPTVALSADHRYLDRFLTGASSGGSTKLSNIVYGLEIGYDLGHALNMPKEYGTVKLTAFVDYSQALGRDDVLNDEFWGGMRVTYAW
jgi:hypothetical protein